VRFETTPLNWVIAATIEVCLPLLTIEEEDWPEMSNGDSLHLEGEDWLRALNANSLRFREEQELNVMLLKGGIHIGYKIVRMKGCQELHRNSGILYHLTSENVHPNDESKGQ
jgi:hypothetical protein